MSNENKNYDPLLTMAALNMAVVSLHRITSTKDRLILDQEYKNIINNLRYELSDNYRLTQNALEKFNLAISENSPSKRLRMLKYIEGEFAMYSPYWFYRAKAAEEADDKTEAEKSFAKFNEVWRPVLRKDPYKVEALKFQIDELTAKGFSEKLIEKFEKETPPTRFELTKRAAEQGYPSAKKELKKLTTQSQNYKCVGISKTIIKN